MNRRTVLVLAGTAGATGLAGCLDDISNNSNAETAGSDGDSGESNTSTSTDGEPHQSADGPERSPEEAVSAFYEAVADDVDGDADEHNAHRSLRVAVATHHRGKDIKPEQKRDSEEDDFQIIDHQRDHGRCGLFLKWESQQQRLDDQIANESECDRDDPNERERLPSNLAGVSIPVSAGVLCDKDAPGGCEPARDRDQ